MKAVGARVRALDWRQRTDGSARYTADLPAHGLPTDGVLVGRILRSPVPHGRIRSLDTSRAAGMPGVHAVVTAGDLRPNVLYQHRGGTYSDRPGLAGDVVRFIGQEIAGVAADTGEQADAAVAAIGLSVRRLRAPLAVEQALRRGAPTLHTRPDGPNVALRWAGTWGDPDAGRAASAVEVRGRSVYPSVAQAPMEPETTIAWWHPATGDGEGWLELWTSTQAPYFVAKELAHLLDIAEDRVICREIAVGGGFGVKSKIGEHEIVAALLSRKAGRAVMIALSRDEEFAFTKPRHRFVMDLCAGADADGRIRFLDARIDVDNGAFNHHGPSVLKVGTMSLGSMYRPDGVRYDSRLVDTATQPGGPYRGYGAPQVVLALESAVDRLAAELHLDPLELRLRNLPEPGSTTLCGYRVGTDHLEECLHAAADAIGWHDKRRNSTPLRGVGIAAGMHGSGAYAYELANRSDAAVDVHDDGTIAVRFGGADAGTGQRTIVAQVAAEHLGVDPSEVRVLSMDGERTPFDMGAWSSRGTHMSGNATAMAAGHMAERLRRLAEQKLGTDDVALAGGRAESPNGHVDLGDLVRLSGEPGGVMTEEASYVSDDMEPLPSEGNRANVSPSYSFAAHAAEVEVDPGTGRVRVLGYAAAHDLGVAINPTMAEGQIVGGVAMGLGAALGEDLIHERGRLVNGAYVNYALPRAADLPRITPIIVPSEEPAGPHGAKAVGEMAIIPVGAAVANAVAHAIGVRIDELPITPDKVLAALARRDGRDQRRRFRIGRRPTRWEVALLRWAYPRGLLWLLDRFGPSRRRPVREPTAVTEPATVAEAVADLAGGGTPLGGGTDLVVRARQGLAAPVVLVSTERIDALRAVSSTADGIAIGGSVTLDRLADEVGLELPVVAEAVATIASPQIRAMATVAGNLLQANRCWFLRNGFDCYKRGGAFRPCYAVVGDHRFSHAALGAHRCQAVTPSDLATVLAALDATVEVESAVGRREIPVDRLYRGPGESVLRSDDLLTAVRITPAVRDRTAAFEKLRMYEGDFAVASAAVSAVVRDGRWRNLRIVLGSISPTPWRARRTETALGGTAVDPARFRAELDEELERTGHPLARNAWKLDAVAALAERAAERLLA